VRVFAFAAACRDPRINRVHSADGFKITGKVSLQESQFRNVSNMHPSNPTHTTGMRQAERLQRREPRLNLGAISSKKKSH